MEVEVMDVPTVEELRRLREEAFDHHPLVNCEPNEARPQTWDVMIVNGFVAPQTENDRPLAEFLVYAANHALTLLEGLQSQLIRQINTSEIARRELNNTHDAELDTLRLALNAEKRAVKDFDEARLRTVEKFDTLRADNRKLAGEVERLKDQVKQMEKGDKEQYYQAHQSSLKFLLEAEKELKQIDQLTDFPCLDSCDSFAHAEECPQVYPVHAVKALTLKIERLDEALRITAWYVYCNDSMCVHEACAYGIVHKALKGVS